MKTLGVTAAELLPIHEYPQFDDPVGGATADRINYWGYMTTQFFAPNREYLCTDTNSCTYVAGEQVTKFKDMVKALHAQGVEVWLDVVFNHTWEGGACSGNPVRYINLRGIDNATYYTLADDKSCYWDSTGTGNNLNASRAAVRNLIVDSLTYWANTMHVDGFRFDLAYELGREGTDGRDFNNNATDPGRDRPGRLEQRLQGDRRALGHLAASASASSPPAGRSGTATTATTCGSTRRGTTARWATSAPRSPPPGRGSRRRRRASTSSPPMTASPSTTSSPTTPSRTAPAPATRPARTPAAATTPTSVGTAAATRCCAAGRSATSPPRCSSHQGSPMLLAGDEFRRTQSGNNNGYMADNACGWIDWSLKTTNQKTYDFFRKLIAFRKAHPGLRRSVALRRRRSRRRRLQGPRLARHHAGHARLELRPRTRWPG